MTLGELIKKIEAGYVYIDEENLQYIFSEEDKNYVERLFSEKLDKEVDYIKIKTGNVYGGKTLEGVICIYTKEEELE